MRVLADVRPTPEQLSILQDYRPEQRGSSVKTSILAAVVAWLFKKRPAEALSTCANRLGTDTDSIATMAGALIGATIDDQPDFALVERPYIIREAERLWAIGAGKTVPSFPYPSIMNWAPPRTQIDCLGAAGSDLALAGLGPVRELAEKPAGSDKSDEEWVWGDLWFGQRILVKRRPRPRSLPQSQIVNPQRSLPHRKPSRRAGQTRTKRRRGTPDP